MNQSIEELVVAKYLCETSTLHFTRYFFKHRFNRKFVVGDHHVAIARALDDVVAGKIKKLIINIAPRYGKTEVAVKNFMAKGLAVNPASRFIHLSYSDDLALDNSEEVRDIVSHPAYQQMFPKVKVKPKSDAKKKWYTTAGGGIYATSTAGQVTGFGAGRVDEEDEDADFDFLADEQPTFAGALIIDDSIKPEDADSEVVRNRVNARWDSTIKNRVNSRNTPIVIIGQRLHPDDLCGYVLQQSPGEWTVMSFPCIKEDGTALWEFKHTIEELMKLKQENEVVFERQYQQNPQPLEGLLFPSSDLNRFRMADLRTAEAEARYGYIDVADQGDDNLAFPMAHIFPAKIFLTDVYFTKAGTEITIPECAAKIDEHGLDFIRIESNNQGKMFRALLSDYIAMERLFLITNTANKHSRILVMAGFIKKYFYFLDQSEIIPGSHYAKFMKELTDYMKDGSSTRDDAPDALSGLAKMIRKWLKHLFPLVADDKEE